MASQDLNAAMPAPAHPMANPGYGKRSAPDQLPSLPGHLGHLPPRERYVAAFVDRLPDGAAMDAKSLAKAQPLYGQQAVRTALNELSRAGHLRRVRTLAEGDGGTGVTRWVFRTYWSRTARDSEWWARFLAGDVPNEARPDTSAQASVTTAPPAAPGDVAPQRPEQAAEPPSPRPPATPSVSAAYAVLAQLGRAEPRLLLSAADCAALEELASAWLVRGATVDHLTHALVSGLPEQVHSPRAFLQRRLRDKLPPELAELPEPPTFDQRPAPRVRLIMECTECRVPGRPEALPGGLCRACRATPATGVPPAALPSLGRRRYGAGEYREVGVPVPPLTGERAGGRTG